MLCYVCIEQGTERPAVALCRGCNAGLCLEHLRETAARFASSHILDSCHHSTWAVTKQPATRSQTAQPPPLERTA